MRLLIALITAFLAVAPAAARGPAEALEAWGILGSWAPFCDRLPSDDNVYYIWAERDGRAVLERRGGSFGDVSPITDARITADGMLEYRVVFGRHAMVNTWRKDETRIRIMSNRHDGGRPTVEDGRLVHNGAETPWHRRCVGSPA